MPLREYVCPICGYKIEQYDPILCRPKIPLCPYDMSLLVPVRFSVTAPPVVDGKASTKR